MQKTDFRQEIAQRVVVADGSVATLIYNRGIYINASYDELNLSQPDLIQDIHREFFTAGAEILTTNTYGANRVRLEAMGHDDKLRDINLRGAEIARQASRGQVSVAGSLGRLSKDDASPLEMDSDAMMEVYREQVLALLDGGVDLIWLESAATPEEAKAAVRAVRDLGDTPIIVTCSAGYGSYWHKHGVEALAQTFNELEIDAGGVDGLPGPHELLEIVEALALRTDRPLVARPGAGYPRMVEGRSLHMAQPEYLAKFARRFFRAGVRVFGAGNGTTTEHTRSVSAMIRSLQPTKVAQTLEIEDTKKPETPVGMEPVPRQERSAFASKVGKEFVFVVEIDPPKGLNAKKAIEGAKMLQGHGVSCINIADGPRATARMNPIYLGKLIQEQVGIDTLVHFCTRDRNVLALQSDLMGMHALGMHNVLAVTGDPPKLGDYPFASAVFDIDSIGLLKMISGLNRGLDFAGNVLKQQTKFFKGCGVDPGSTNLEEELRRLHLKIDAGTEFVMTQPVYDHTIIDRFAERIQEVTVPILIGVLPLYSSRNAEFLHNEIPGMSVPQETRDRLAAAATPEGQRAVGVEIAAEALKHAQSLPQVKGVYLMPPFGKYTLAVEILRKAGWVD